MQADSQLSDIISTQNVFKITFFAFCCGLVFALGQSVNLTLAHLAAFSYADFVLYAVFGFILAFLIWVVIGIISNYVVYPIDQFRKILAAVSQKKDRLEIAFHLAALLAPFWIVPLIFGYPQFSFDLRAINITAWLLFAGHMGFIFLLRVSKKYEPAGTEHALDVVVGAFRRSAFSAPGILILIVSLFASGIFHVELMSRHGREVRVVYNDGSFALDARMISSTSKGITVYTDEKYIFISRESVRSVEFYASGKHSKG